MNGTTTELTRDNVREVAQLRVDGTSWKKIGTLYGVAETTAKTAFTRAVHALGLMEHPEVAKAIPADLPAAIVAALTPEPETPEPAPQPERDDDHVVAIVSDEYRQTVKALLADPIIDDMAHGLLGTPQDQLTHANGEPVHEFMMASLHEYNKREGKVETHIGGPSAALLVRLAELRQAQVDDVAEDIREAELDARTDDTDLAAEVGQQVREDAAAAKAETDPAPATDTDTADKHDHCVKCGWEFGHYQKRSTCGSPSACQKRQADPTRQADKRRQPVAA